MNEIDTERKDQLIRNLIHAYRVEMDEEELKNFLILEIGLREEEYELYSKPDPIF